MRATCQSVRSVLGRFRYRPVALVAGMLVSGVVLALGVSGSAARQDARARVAGPAIGGGTSGTVKLHQASALTLAVSPDHTIAMNFLGNLWTLPATGGTAKRVTDLLQDTAYPTWSPDSKTIAFQSYRSGTFHIWAMSPDGSNVRELTSGFYDDREPMFSPDGSEIAFSSDRPPAGSAPGTIGGSYNVWVLAIATGELRQVTHAAVGSNDYYPTWTPDANQITFVASGKSIASISADGQGAPQTLYSTTADTLYSPTWSPDGKSLAYTELTNGGTLTQLMINGTAVSGNEDVFAFPAPWVSNDSLIYAADGKIWQRNITSGTRTAVPFTADVGFNRPAYRMKRHNFEAHAAKRAVGILNPALAPDGQHIAFVALNQLWEMALRGRPHALTNDPYYKADPTWSPDGRYLAFSSDRDGPMAIYIRDLHTGKTRKLTAPFGAAQARMAWSPDGKKIAFETALDAEAGAQELYVADVATGAATDVWGTKNATGVNYSVNFEPGRPTWGPDSTTLALAVQQSYSNRFREGVSKILTLNVATGATNVYDADPADPYQTITTRTEGNGPVWSPDGKWMAYVMDNVPWVVPVSATGAPTGPPRQLSQEVADQLSWSGDSRHLLYDSAGTLRLVPVDGGAPTTVPVRLRSKPTPPPAGEKVIHAGTLWAGTSASEQHNVDIVIRGNLIQSVQPARPRSAYGRHVQYVNSARDTVIPGLWDAHVHEGMDQPYAGGRRTRLELALGITSEMSMGDEPYRALEQVESQQSGARPGPRYFWDAEPIDGHRIYYSWMRASPDLTAFNRDLARVTTLDPDILKTYVRLPNSYEKIAIQAGHELRIPSFSHYFWPALAFGQDGTAHWATQRLGYQIAVSNDNIAYNDTIALYARSGMSITNTAFFGVQYLPQMNGKPTLSDPRLTTLLSPWQYAAAEQLFASGPLTPASLRFLQGWGNADARILAAGGTVLGGTDNPIGMGNFGDVVAVSVLAHTGLTNYQALRAFTVEPAKIMGVSHQLGTIRAGMVADMDIIKGNPLQNIETIANDAYVVQNGRIYTERELLGPYANVHLNTPPATGSAADAARGVSRTLALYGRPWVTPSQLGKLEGDALADDFNH